MDNTPKLKEVEVYVPDENGRNEVRDIILDIVTCHAKSQSKILLSKEQLRELLWKAYSEAGDFESFINQLIEP